MNRQLTYRRFKNVILSFILVSISTFSISQLDLDGKSFRGKTGETCKLKSDGGCWIVDHTILAFEKDSVTVSYDIEGFCTPEDDGYNKKGAYPEKFKWVLRKNEIQILGFDRFGNYDMKNSRLYGRLKQSNGDEALEFILQE